MNAAGQVIPAGRTLAAGRRGPAAPDTPGAIAEPGEGARTGTPPHLSLAVCARGACDPLEFLRALQTEAVFAGPGAEVHIAHDGGWPSAVSPPHIHLHACPPGSSVARLWGEAIARSTAPYVAVLDIHVPPSPGWLRRVEAEIAAGTPLFFGPVDPGWSGSDRRILGYLIEYAQFRGPIPRNLGEVPGNNLVGLRELLTEPGGGSGGTPAAFFKTFAIWRLARERGLSPRCFDDMAVVYRKGFALGPYLSARLAQGRSFAGRRHTQPGQPSRLLCIAFTPLLPVLRLWRILRAADRDGMLRRAARRYLPLLLLAETAWSAGELLGYLAGPAGPEE